MKTVMKTFMWTEIEEFFGVSGNTRSERHGAERPTKDQLKGFMVGTMKGFMVNEAGFARLNSGFGSQRERPRRNTSSRGSWLAP